MRKYVCLCGYTYAPEIGSSDNGIAPGTQHIVEKVIFSKIL